MATTKAWSVKGIDPEAREAAKAAAKAAGMTLGEWLNHQIANLNRAELTDGIATSAKTADLDADVLQRLADTERRTTLAITGIDQSVAGVAARLKAAEDQVDRVWQTQAEELSAIKAQSEKALKDLSAGQKDVAKRLSKIESDTQQAEQIGTLDTSLSQLRDRLDSAQELLYNKLDTSIERAELRQERNAEDLRRKVDDATQLNSATLSAIKSEVDAIGSRLNSAETITDESLKALRTSVEGMSGRMDGFETAITEIDSLTAQLQSMVSDARRDIVSELETAIIAPESARMQDALDQASARIRKTELAQADGLRRINTHIANLALAVDARFQEQDAMLGQTGAVESLEERLTLLEQHTIEATDVNQAELSRTSNNLAARISNIEVSSAKALDEIGSRVIKITEELSGKQASSQSGVAEQLADVETRTMEAVEDAHADIVRRFDQFTEKQQSNLAPLERSIATLTSRMEAMESGAIAMLENAPSDTPPPFPGGNDSAPAYAPPPAAKEYSGAAQDNVVPMETWIDPNAAAATATPYQAYAQYDEPVNPGQAPQYGSNGNAAYAEPQAYAAWTPEQAQPAQNPYADSNPSAQNAYADVMGAASESLASSRPGGDAPAKPKNSRRALLMGVGFAALLAMGAFIMKDRIFPAGGDQTPPASSQSGISDFSAVTDTADDASENYQYVPDTSDDLVVGEDIPLPTADAAMIPDTSIQLQPVTANGPKTLDAAVTAGNPVAQYQMAIAEMQNGQLSEAVRLVKLAANQGLPVAQYRLAKLYERGEGVDVDVEMARKLTERAANAGNRIAMHDLALYHAEGRGGLTENMENAAKWFQNASEHGVLDSQFNLAVLYERGQGVPQNMSDAYLWYSIAARQGDQDASRRAGILAGQLSEADLAAAEARVKNFTPKRIDEQANGVFRDLPWATLAGAKQDVARAQTLLNALGYNVGTADGAMGPKTRNAIIEYERKNGLPETGRVDTTLLQRLELAAAG